MPIPSVSSFLVPSDTLQADRAGYKVHRADLHTHYTSGVSYDLLRGRVEKKGCPSSTAMHLWHWETM